MNNTQAISRDDYYIARELKARLHILATHRILNTGGADTFNAFETAIKPP
jgi:hypothetical protein